MVEHERRSPKPPLVSPSHLSPPEKEHKMRRAAEIIRSQKAPTHTFTSLSARAGGGLKENAGEDEEEEEGRVNVGARNENMPFGCVSAEEAGTFQDISIFIE